MGDRGGKEVITVGHRENGESKEQSHARRARQVEGLGKITPDRGGKTPIGPRKAGRRRTKKKRLRGSHANRGTRPQKADGRGTQEDGRRPEEDGVGAPKARGKVEAGGRGEEKEIEGGGGQTGGIREEADGGGGQVEAGRGKEKDGRIEAEKKRLEM